MNDAIARCGWCGDDWAYIAYHDHEWGVPCRDERSLFEFLVLESMQAGLSWLTILRKRENFRSAFAGFDYEVIADFQRDDRERLLADPGIIRHEKKIDAAIGNARAMRRLHDAGRSLHDLLWDVVDGRPRQNAWRSPEEVPAETEASRLLARRLRDQGFRFVGPRTVYALMQAAGLVNDHLLSCHRHAVCARL